jgi:hypothetical protein
MISKKFFIKKHKDIYIYIYIYIYLYKIFFFIKPNSLKTQRGARKYTRQHLKYGKRITKLQELKKTRNWQSNNAIGTTSSSTITSPSHDLQSSLQSFFSEYTTLNIKEPTSIVPKHYGVPIVLEIETIF